MFPILRAEIIRFKNDYLYYRFNYIFTHINFFFLIMGIFLIFFQKHNIDNTDEFMQFIFGILLWYISYSLIASFAQIIASEILGGTLQQLLMVKKPLYVIFITRLFLHVIWALCFIIMVMAIISLLFSQMTFWAICNRMLIMIFLSILSSVGIVGISFTFASAAFRFKNINALANFSNYIFLFFTGAFIPINNFPQWLKWVTYLIPLTWANNVFQKILSGVSCLRDVQLLSTISISYLILGLLLFRRALKKSRGW